MTVREQIETTEMAILSQYACTSVNDQFIHRDRYEDKCPYRTEFQRDRDVRHRSFFHRSEITTEQDLHILLKYLRSHALSQEE